MSVIITYWKQILILLLLAAIVLLGKRIDTRVIGKKRAEENLRQMQLINSSLSLTAKEFKDLLKTSEQRTIKHIDSLMKINKINPRGVQEVHNIVNNYTRKDSTVIIVPVSNIKLPVSIGDKCWGFSGTITNSQLEIQQRYFSTEIDLVDYARPKKFLFIRVGWHPPNLRAFSDCGTAVVRSYRRVEK